jgi:hypothetical protein
MKTDQSLAVLAAVMIVGFGAPLGVHADDAGVALAIVFDTSGSMKDRVKAANGSQAPKYTIANRALTGVAKALSTYAKAGGTNNQREVQTALFTFRGDHVRQTMALKPLDADELQRWADNFSDPKGNTPLGEALSLSTKCLLASPLPRKHILVITDGMNTVGPKPEGVLPGLKKEAARKGLDLGVHFVAFDVDAKLFEPLRKQGVTVVPAADEKQLTARLDFILQKKILLEDEEPPKTQ